MFVSFQAELNDFLERKERGQLAVQKSSFLNDSLLQQVKRPAAGPSGGLGPNSRLDPGGEVEAQRPR